MTKGPQQETGVTNEKIFEFLVEMDERISTMDERISTMDERITTMGQRMDNMDERITEIRQTMATKDDLERMKEEIIEPILKAVDKDAETLFDHGKRIVVLEQRAGIAR